MFVTPKQITGRMKGRNAVQDTFDRQKRLAEAKKVGERLRRNSRRKELRDDFDRIMERDTTRREIRKYRADNGLPQIIPGNHAIQTIP